MRTTLGWLRDFVETGKNAGELCEKLTGVGLPVASLEDRAAGLRGVVTGRILELQAHPDADRLTLCRVDVGSEQLSIVCGAKNMKQGDAVAVATVGTTLPNGLRIERAKIRGRESFGMMCSSKELGMDEDQAGILILPRDTMPGVPLVKAMGLDDPVLELEITPNRGDCLSVLGVAREIAAVRKVRLKTPPAPPAPKGSGGFDIGIEAKDDCWIYCGCLLEDVRQGESPPWLKRRLESIGLRSLGNVVDITNYVLLTYGQPLHAFDADTLQESKIRVRGAKAGETIQTIDQVTRKLSPGTLVIADGNRPVAVAGVMGGMQTQIGPGTKRVLLESALFNPAAVRHSSRALGLASDSSYRFERGVDTQGVETAMRHAIGMLRQYAGAKPGPIRKVSTRRQMPRRVAADPKRVEALLGAEVRAKDMKDALQRLGFSVRPAKGKMQVSVPSHRWDIAHEVDLAEEYARSTGYDRIPVSIPQGILRTAEGQSDPYSSLRGVLMASGYHEAVDLGFLGADRHGKLRDACGWDRPLAELANPLDQDERFLRPSLLDGLLRALALNQKRGEESVHLFEIGTVFGRDTEKGSVGVVSCGPLPRVHWQGKKPYTDFFHLKGVAETMLAGRDMRFRGAALPTYQPGQGCEILQAAIRVGTLGKLHPGVVSSYGIRGDVFFCEIDGTILLDSFSQAGKRYNEVSRYPAVTRDIAAVLEKKVAVGDVSEFLKARRGGLLEDVELFDLFEGGNIPRGKQSLGFRLRYRSAEKTLTDQEVQGAHQKILDALCSKWGCELREA